MIEAGELSEKDGYEYEIDGCIFLNTTLMIIHHSWMNA